MKLKEHFEVMVLERTLNSLLGIRRPHNTFSAISHQLLYLTLLECLINYRATQS